MDIINNLFKDNEDNDKELKDAKEDIRKIQNEDVKKLLPKPIDIIKATEISNFSWLNNLI